MALVRFTKMHGAGNDFVVVDEWDGVVVPEEGKKDYVSKVCRRHFGVGADGVVFVQRSDKADAKFVFYNPDGSRAEMCGNGIRCFAKYVYERKYVTKNPMDVDSLAGVKTIEVEAENGVVSRVKVDMGVAVVEFADKEVVVDGKSHNVTSVSTGNPHAVLFVPSVDKADVRGMGKAIRNDYTVFPNGTNVHFVEAVASNEFKIRTYERGVEDETLACGTGICASATAAVENRLADVSKRVLFHARGGDVYVELKADFNKQRRIFMIGPAEEVYAGEIEF